MRRVIVLGSTGSIGTQALDVIRRNPELFQIVGLSAATNHELLVGQVREFVPAMVAVSATEAADQLRSALGSLREIKIIGGPDAPERLVRDVEADLVLNAMVGAVGLRPTLAALQSGRTVALANKESLIVGGELVMDLVKGEPERLIPVDSEHAALAQCLRGERREYLRRVIITASGGPFRGWSPEELARASVKEALAHPTWKMGQKITIDSATLMNKGLEVIEAHHLFGLDYSQIDVVVHPESLVHGIAEFRDGSMVAQLAGHDMRLPIQLALGSPDRLPAGIEPLDLAGVGQLTFEAVDRETFPALDLAYRAGGLGSTYPAVLNAANEVAVGAFLEGVLPLVAIPEIVERALDEHEGAKVVSENALERADAWARERATVLIEAH
ncbi:MAG: 1-deoxy-D-xylulose-5-phosphate reductoisomerase [Actinomycetota bacterium]